MRLFIDLTPSVPLSFEGEGEELVLKGLRPFNLPLIYGGWVFKRDEAPLLPHPPSLIKGRGQGIGC